MKLLSHLHYFLILCLLAPISCLYAEKNQKQQDMLREELKSLEAELSEIYARLHIVHDRIGQINEELEKLQQVQTYTLPIYLKLPLTQPRFHWKFLDRKAYLKGSLELVIRNSEGETRTNIFSAGSIHEDWKAMGDHDQREVEANEIYFGFISNKRFDVNRNDTVEVFLTVNEDLKGIGPETQGVLPKGEYRASAQFTIHDSGQSSEGPEYAYVDKDYLNKDNWSKTWDLVITEKTGWLDQRTPEETASKLRESLIRMLTERMEHYEKMSGVYDNPDTKKLIVAYTEALHGILHNELSLPSQYWEELSPKEIRAKYDEIFDSILKLNPRHLPLLPDEELPPELESFKDASKETINKHYKDRLLEILKDVL